MSVEGTKYRYICNKCDQCNYPRVTVDSHVSQSKFTNADRIRAMSDEEIANFLCNVGDCDRRCPAKNGDCIFSNSTCRSTWLEWLKKEQ